VRAGAGGAPTGVDRGLGAAGWRLARRRDPRGRARAPALAGAPHPRARRPRVEPPPITRRPNHPQALKANAEGAVKELRLNANYITRFGQVALNEAVDMVYEMGGGRMTTVLF
jgi:hypothetical protein